jgi:ABC-type branched-subunit amino acid transport system ATPase component
MVAGENILSLFFRGGRIRSDEKAAREKALAYLDLVGLSDKQNQKAGELSYGQRKLLELTRILMLDPGLILLDEPAAGINPALISKLLTIIQRLKAQGKRFLIIEHNMDVVIRLCDWVYVLDAGTPIAEGPPEKIKNDPVVLEAYFGK